MEPTTDLDRPPKSRKRTLFALLIVVSATTYVLRISRSVTSPSDATPGTAATTLVEPDSANSSAQAGTKTVSSASVFTAGKAGVDDQASIPPPSGTSAILTSATDNADNGSENPDESSAVESDAALKKLMLGTWEDDYKGHRTLTLLEDGSGTMVVELDGFAATLFAAKLTFTEKWSVEDGHVTMKATGGEPSGKVRLVLNLHGDSSTQEIVEVTNDRMVLVEKPSGTRFEWRRVKESEKP